MIEMPKLPSNLQRAGIYTLNIFNNIRSILIVVAIFILLNMFAPVFLIFKFSEKWFAKYIKK
jgi:hypothetical protein